MKLRCKEKLHEPTQQTEYLLLIIQKYLNKKMQDDTYDKFTLRAVKRVLRSYQGYEKSHKKWKTTQTRSVSDDSSQNHPQ